MTSLVLYLDLALIKYSKLVAFFNIAVSILSFLLAFEIGDDESTFVTIYGELLSGFVCFMVDLAGLLIHLLSEFRTRTLRDCLDINIVPRPRNEAGLLRCSQSLARLRMGKGEISLVALDVVVVGSAGHLMLLGS